MGIYFFYLLSLGVSLTCTPRVTHTELCWQLNEHQRFSVTTPREMLFRCVRIPMGDNCRVRGRQNSRKPDVAHVLAPREGHTKYRELCLCANNHQRVGWNVVFVVERERGSLKCLRGGGWGEGGCRWTICD